jgi:uncharacterized small protein (DUF1192 family)
MTTYYQPLFNYLSNEHGLHLLESDMCEIINIVSNMKKQQRIAILESEISRLKVANRTTNERLTAIEGELGLSYPDYLSIPIKSNPSGIPNTCLNVKPESPECVANNGVGEKRAGIKIHTSNLDNPVKPDFVPDWEDAPEDAVCVAMDKNGNWFWWRYNPIAELQHNDIWSVEGGNGLSQVNHRAGNCTNAHLLPEDYWKGTLMMRPEPVAGDWATAPDWAKYKAMDADGTWNWYSGHPFISGSKWLPCLIEDKHKLIPNHPPSDKPWDETLEARPDVVNDSVANISCDEIVIPDNLCSPCQSKYSPLLPQGYEFCEQGEHEKFVKVELFGGVNEEPVGFITDYNIFIGKYLPIRKSAPDYSHLLPEGYEFCSEEDAVKWVKVEMMPDSTIPLKAQGPIGGLLDAINMYKEITPYYRPIRPIQYKVTTHEIVDAVPDPYMPDWSKAPEGTVAHCYNKNKNGFWGIARMGDDRYWADTAYSHHLLPPDLDWKQSLRVKPSK